MKKTKIICTMGPACSDVETIKKMIKAGMNVARFNMSHGTHQSHHIIIEAVKKARTELNASVAIMIDTNGPEIRVGEFDGGSALLEKGQQFVFTTEKVLGNSEMASVSLSSFASVVRKDDIIFANDGLVKFQVQSIHDKSVVCKVLVGGKILNRKSLNIPGVKLEIPYLSNADKEHLLFGIKEDADIYALSFVCSKQDVNTVRKFLKQNGEEKAILCSKIESARGVQNLEEIVLASDSVMVARGDLGVEIEFEKIPKVQKDIINLCNKYGKNSITATEMLESMIENPRPTRAEISDVANAVEDRTSAVMLSGETSIGKYPVLTVETMARIVEEREKSISYGEPCPTSTQSELEPCVGFCASELARSLDVSAITVATFSGLTAKSVSRFRTKCPIVACTPNKRSFHQMSLYFGVVPVLGEFCDNITDLLKANRQKALELGLVKNGDRVVQVASFENEQNLSNMVLVSIV